MTITVHVALLVAFLALAAVFAAIQEAFSTLTKGRAGKLVADEAKRAATIAAIVADPAPTVSTALFLRLVGEVGFTVTLTHLFAQTLAGGAGPLVGAGAIALVALFVLVSVSARTLGRQRRIGVATATCGLMKVLTAVLYIVPQAMILIGNVITPGRGYPDGPFASEDELREFVEMAEASNQIEADERKMIYSVFDLGDTLVREVMVPRPDVLYVEEGKTLRQALSLALRSGFSRIPVTGAKGLDDIIGIVYLKDIVKRVYDYPDAQSSELVTSLMRPVTWCPDSKPADDLLREMQAAHTHLVVVVDEFGGTAGVITIEDLLEEIVGEIQDEFDRETDPVTEVADGVYRVSSRLSLADLGDLFGLELDDEDVDSIGGILAKTLNKVPIPGSTVDWEGLEMTADQYTGRRHQIATILVRRAEPDQAPAADISTPEGDA
ncbi:MAG: hemolysin family protein [Propionibacteriaceae bacterium]|jgi:CBS domain containing-hemolysin-like protein|nr:hemolysin family protein [Propionibacteriaceae bacterium]